MKFFLVLAIAILGAHAVPLNKEVVSAKFEEFKKTHGKIYSTVEEESARKAIFETKLAKVEEHNAKYVAGLVSYQLAINKFSDLTEAEMMPYTHGLKKPAALPLPSKLIVNRTSLNIVEPFDLPTTFDWRDYGVVSPVKNQGGCGACWAFSANGAIEAQARIKYGIDHQITVSEQQLLDCIYEDGCAGGWMADCYTYIAQTGGIDNDQVYPYEVKQGSCRFRSDAIAAQTTGYAYLTGPDEAMLADMVYTQGPVSVAIDADGDFGYYSTGVYYNPDCTDHITHAVVIVGFGTENGQDYWMVKNSWGADWGDNGYIKMARNRNNNCAIASYASYPVLP